MINVWIMGQNGSVDRQNFTDDVEALNYTKSRSLNAMCAIIENSNKKVFVYENGEVANPVRSKEVMANVEEILLNQVTRDITRIRKK